MKLSDVKVGDVLIARGDFDCLQPEQRCEVKSDAAEELYVTCARRRHYLNAQQDEDGNLIGFEPCL